MGNGRQPDQVRMASTWSRPQLYLRGQLTSPQPPAFDVPLFAAQTHRDPIRSSPLSLWRCDVRPRN